MRSIIPIFCLFISFSLLAQERFITIDTTEILVNTIGLESRKDSQPVIVMESGLGTPMGHWDRILKGASELAPIVTYDRPGIGKSEAVDELPTIENVSKRLLTLLDTLNVEPPFILVGHSLGGVYIRGFAVHHPELLAGLVIIDPGDFTETQQNKRDYYKVFDWDNQRIDSMIMAVNKKLDNRQKNAPPAIRREGQVLSDLRKNDFKVIQENPLPNIPVHIIAGGRFDFPKKFWSKEYDEETLFRSKMRYRLARWMDVVQSVDKGMFFYSGDAGHFVHYDDPELVISSISIVLQDYKLLQQK